MLTNYYLRGKWIYLFTTTFTHVIRMISLISFSHNYTDNHEVMAPSVEFFIQTTKDEYMIEVPVEKWKIFWEIWREWVE